MNDTIGLLAYLRSRRAEGVARAVDERTRGCTVHKGSVEFAGLPTNPTAGWEYLVTDAFTTDLRFREGPGVSIPAGATVIFDADGWWEVESMPGGGSAGAITAEDTYGITGGEDATAQELLDAIAERVVERLGAAIEATGTTLSLKAENGSVISSTTTQDTTYSQATTASDGLLRQLDGDGTHYLRGDGTWQTPPDTDTTYTAGAGLSLTGTEFSNAGVTAFNSRTGPVSPSSHDYAAAQIDAADTDGITGTAGATVDLQSLIDEITERVTERLAASMQASGRSVTIYASDGSTLSTVQTQDTTYSQATTAADGLLRQLDGNTAHYLRGDGTWQTPPDTQYSVVSKTANGLAPQLPNETTTTKYLRQDGSWQVPPNDNTDTNVTQTATSGNANYEVLFSGTADNTTRTEGARKASSLTYNPSTGRMTMTGHLAKSGVSSNWNKGRDNALVKMPTLDGYSPMLSQKTTDGTWDFGVYTRNKAYLTYITDADYASNNRTTGQYMFSPMGQGVVADMSQPIKSISRSGTTFTATRVDGTTFTFTQQDSVDGGNASKLNGYASDTAKTANTVVRRDANGYIYAAYYNQSSSEETSATNARPCIIDGSGWHRKFGIAAFRNLIGLGNTTGAVPVANGGTGATAAWGSKVNITSVASGSIIRTSYYEKDAYTGLVHLLLACGGCATGVTLFTLASGYRPKDNIVTTCGLNNGYGGAFISSSGGVTLSYKTVDNGNQGGCFLDIVFKCA